MAPQPQVVTGGGGAVGGSGGALGGAGGAGGVAGAGTGAGVAAAGAAMMAAGTGMMMMNPTMALFPIMLAGASFAKVTQNIICTHHSKKIFQGYFIAHLLGHAPRRVGFLHPGYIQRSGYYRHPPQAHYPSPPPHQEYNNMYQNNHYE